MRVAQVIGKLSAAGVEAVVNNYYYIIDHSRVQFDYFIDEDSICTPPAEIISLGARYYYIPSTKRVFARIRALYNIFKMNKYEIVHAHMNTLNMPVLLAARLANIPVRISHNHSTSDQSEGYRAMLKCLLRPTARWWATDFMACGQRAAEWMFTSHMLKNGLVTILPNAIDVEQFRFRQDTRHAIRLELGAENRFIVGHVGRFTQQKNHIFLLEAFNKLHARRADAMLLLVGEGELRADIEKYVKKQGIADCVRFMGIRKDIAQLYCAMDVFVLPSFYEGLPVVGIEAQAAGLPCVFSTNVDPSAAIGGEVRFLSLKRGPEQWANAIEACTGQIDRPSAADKVRVCGYDIFVEGRKLEAIYEAMNCRKNDIKI